MLTSEDFVIDNLGECKHESPLVALASETTRFVGPTERVLVYDDLEGANGYLKQGLEMPSMERAGPRDKVFFESETTRAAIVTCGGLCPGLNDVIRGLVMQLYHRYGVKTIYGFRFGYEGIIPGKGQPAVMLHPEGIESIQMMGGTILGSSRGPQPIDEMVDQLVSMGINMLFVIGGDGSLRGSQEIADEVKRRGEKISVVGIPKTIDNDIMYVDKSFGFETAFAEAVKSITAAHVEARGAPNGIGLVKLMGRHSGFIACFAALAEGEANFVLIPEVPFKMEGEHGFLHEIEQRIERRNHAVVVVAEGAGQDLVGGHPDQHDASGNVRLADIGTYLADRIKGHFAERDIAINLKYFDPSYIIRSVPANAQDSVFCNRLAQNAVHAAMTGKTSMTVGRWHGHFVHIPTRMVTQARRRVDPDGELWLSVLECTGQPAHLH